AGPVFADQGVDFAPLQFQVNASQGQRRAEALANAGHIQAGLAHGFFVQRISCVAPGGVRNSALTRRAWASALYRPMVAGSLTFCLVIRYSPVLRNFAGSTL